MIDLQMTSIGLLWRSYVGSQFCGSESPINQSEGCSKPHFWWLNALFSCQPYKKTLDFLPFRIIQARIDFKECCTSTFLPTSFMLSWGFLECQTGLNHLPYQASRLGHSKTNFGRYQCPRKPMVQWRGLSSQIRENKQTSGDRIDSISASIPEIRPFSYS